MRYVIEFNRGEPDSSSPEDTAQALAKIINGNLNFYWGSDVTVTPERNAA